MTNDEAFLRRAVQEHLLTEDCATQLGEEARQRDTPASAWCLKSGKLTAIQVEAIEGLVQPGLVAEGFSVEGLLGHGGVGIVYRARQPALDRVVALKTISMTRLEADQRTTAIARFQQEARVVARLQHPNIVAAYDFGANDQRVHLAMELINGEDLDSYILRRFRLEERVAWGVADQVIGALAHAKALGVVHRDIKPANLLVTEPPAGYSLPAGTPLIKVTDFGLARFHQSSSIHEHETRLTMDGVTLGTPHYMAPEQIDSAGDVTFAADVYSLGATVFHMLAGRPPWADLSALNVFGKKMTRKPPPLEQLPEEVSEGSRALLAQMMAAEPNDRPTDYQQLQVAVRELLGEMSDGSPIPPPTPHSAAADIHDLETRFDTEVITRDDAPDAVKRQPAGRRLLWPGMTTGVLLLFIGVASFWNTSSAPPEAMYRESERFDAAQALYGGTSIVGWQGVARASRSSDEAGMLRVFNVAKVALQKPCAALPDPKHFAISVRVKAKENAALEIWYDVAENGELLAARVADGRLTLGRRADERSAFIADGESMELTLTSLAPNPVIRIDRDETHWFIGQSVPGVPPPPRNLGWRRHASPGPPEWLMFKAEGDDVFIGDVEVVAMERKPINASDNP